MSTGADRPDGGERRHLLRDALAAIERLQARLDAAEAAAHEPIAIVGIGCRLPGGVADPESFWALLEQGRDVVGSVPAERWDVAAYHDPDPSVFGKARTTAGGFLDEVFGFEPGFFGMSPREATGLDPQQRLLLEVSWEALEHAAIAPDRLDGSRTGVFIGITSTDYAQRIDITDPARSDIYLATGTALNAAAGRLSFTLGLQGPCMAIDTACSSSLVAIHTACQSLRNRESTLAIAGGVNLMLAPEPYVLISKWGMLSPDGRCKTFDASANGFVRGEGCGLVVLERLSDALAHGRRVLAVIRGSAINQDGRSSGLTVPNGIAQQAVIRQALAAAQLKPADVSYVEAHGTGTSLGDPIEVEALAAAYGPAREAAGPLEIGSVKSNIGHLEAAAGVTGLIKAVLALQQRRLPASLHVTQPSPAIPWARLPVRVSTTLHDWTPRQGPRRAGVSAFGFSGMNAHLIVEQAPAPAAAAPVPTGTPQLFVLSARNEAGLAALAQRHAQHLLAHPALPLAEVCATAALGRAHLGHRLAVLAPDLATLVQRLQQPEDAGIVRGQATPGVRPRVAFLFTGQGSQQVGMGRELDETEPVFRATLDRCAAVLDPLLERPLRELLFAETGALDRTGNTQPALFALEVALAALWRHWGIEPAAVIGHSVGEYAAAVVAGVLTLEDGARLIAARARLMQALPAGGAMLAVQGEAALVERAVESAVAARSAQLAIAARNAPGQWVIAGAQAAVDAAAAELAAQGLRTQPLSVSHAFHSPLMEPMLTEFHHLAAGVPHAAPRVAWISNLGGGLLDWAAWGHRMADYWTRHVREPVAFEAGIGTLLAQGCDVALEIGPSGTLCALAQACAGETSRTDWLPSLRRGRRASESTRDALARLYVRGAQPDWRAIVGESRASLRLPTYPFQRRRFLIEARSAAQRPAAGPSIHPLLGARVPAAGLVALFERRVRRDDPPWLADHVIGGSVLMPLTAWLESALAAARQLRGDGVAVEDLDVGEAMVLAEAERVLQVVVDEHGPALRVRIFSRADDAGEWTLHATARIGAPAAGTPVPAPLEATEPVDVATLHDRLKALGVDFGPSFQALHTLRRGAGGAVGEVELPAALAAEAARMSLHPALLDACFHAAAVAIEGLPGSAGRLFLPVGADRFSSLGPAAPRLVSHARVRATDAHAELLRVDILVATPEGRPVASIEGLRCQHVSGRRAGSDAAERWFYEVGWRAAPLPPEAPLRGRWLLLDDGLGLGARLAAEMTRRGATVDRLAPDAALTLQHLQPAPAGVVSLRALRVPALTDEAVPGALQRDGSEAALALLQALAGAPAPLWLVTSGTESVDGSESPNPAQAPVAGLARVAALELPDLRVTHVDLDTPPAGADLRALADGLAAADAEPRIALRKGQRFVARLQRVALDAALPLDEAPVQLVGAERGTLESLRLVPLVRRAPGPGEVELRVRASGLNFRDVLLALGLYPGEVPRLGSDCAGEVVAVGPGVTGFAVGDRVVAMVEGAFASHATTRAEFVASLPSGLSFEHGAAVPSAWLTAEITLNQIARLSAGQRVLIHAGAGGVGMAAVSLALRAGAEVFATAGSDEKRAVLASLGVPHVLDSRSPSFADEVLRRTGGRGVDVVLNSLAGAMMDRSFEVTAEGGTFLEIGKRDLWTPERVAALGRGIRYHVVDCSERARETPALVGRTLRHVLDDLARGALPELPRTCFALADAPAAFRHMAQARHIGRVVLRHPVDAPRLPAPVRSEAVHLVTGGTRGIGLVTARWLVERGACHLVLAARSAPDAAAQAEIDALRTAGATIDVVAVDLGRDDDVEALMQVLRRSGRPLGGVLHGAAALDDGVLLKLDAARLAAAMAAKADGAWRLDRALRRHGLAPDFFVLHSSMSATLGSPGQGNYVAANACLDVLARHRRARDLPATAVAWGAWQAVGMAARGGAATRADDRGFAALAPAQGVQALERLLQAGVVQAAVAPVDWARAAQRLGDTPPPLLRELVDGARPRGATPTGAGVDLAAMPAEARRPHLAALLRRELAVVLGVSPDDPGLGEEAPFTALGLDSLTSVELRNRLQRAVGRPVAATAAFEFPTIGRLADHLATLFADGAREEMSL